MSEELKLSKRDKRVYNHLKESGSITSWEAIKEYGCTRLADAIFHLRKKGINVSSEDEYNVNRYGERVKYTRYILHE